MDKESFVADMTMGYAPKKDEDKKNDYVNKINVLASMCPDENLQQLYNFAVSSEGYPSIKKMFQFGREQGFIQEKKRDTENIVYWNVCKNCGCNYSKTGRGCPRCRKIPATIKAADVLPQNIVEVQEDCFYCADIYKESVKEENSRKIYFQGCNDYGKKQDNMCNSCQCQECCKQMIAYNCDYRGTIEKYNTTELAQPWLIKAPPLNETVKAIVDSIGRRYKQKQEEKGVKNE